MNVSRAAAAPKSMKLHSASESKKSASSKTKVENSVKDPLAQQVRLEAQRLEVQQAIAHLEREKMEQEKHPWATVERLTECREVHGDEVVTRALEISQNIWKVANKLALKKPELFEIVLYIETKLPAKIEDKKYYLKKEKTGLARTIEYDPQSKLTFIHLKTHGIDRLGKGWHKKVTKSIMYDAKNPEIVANSTFMDDGDEEIRTVKKIKNQPGLAHTYAITEHKKDKTGKSVISLIQRLYNGGNLLDHLHNGTSLSKKELVVVARDLMHGLEAMHSKDMVHRDLHGGNFLIDTRIDPVTGKKVLSAVLIDLGQARDATDAKREAPKVQVPHRFNPPEAFWRDKTWIDTKKVDVYALGLNLYNLYFKKQASWAVKEDFKHITSFDDGTKLSFRKKLTRKMEKSLAAKKTSDTFARLILQMLEPDQNKRHSAAHFRKELDALIKKR